jgi:hypothetical protein
MYNLLPDYHRKQDLTQSLLEKHEDFQGIHYNILDSCIPFAGISIPARQHPISL